MNTDLEARLTESMHHQVDGLTLSGDVLTRAGRRHRRRTTAIRLGSVLGVAALAFSAAFALNQGPAPDATTPSLRLANAAAASDDISYRIKLTTNGLNYEGAFDPRTDTGYVRAPQDDSVMTELLINGTRYTGGEPPLDVLPSDKGEGEIYGRYGVSPGTYDHLSLYGGGVLGAASPDPAALFAALRTAGATVTENADGSLHFEYTTQTSDGSTATKGDVTLDADGRIAKVAMTGTWQSTAKGRLDTGTFSATLELYDYGVPVTVERPKDVVPAN
ncbi:hypothetical protein KZZ52_58280 [Dactylosporangium sp. AC04546]|uniref:hypothetical protein n=1 Tax=Dactylosporangium sp. AC04546 TaxID=2862460 RepID=UPI001EDDBA5A|nr:hypothetical protein [Dactylosporangium sp. AC04546]WVK83547.1 hypothetical protein KZZ52_58280 [Dactylosporangium sp. AC04546]